MEKINIAEILKDCPEGMELDCTTWENVTFEKIMDNKIFIRRNDKPSFDNIVVLNKYGCTTDYPDEKCRIFPKGKTTWEGFHKPFVEGDIIYVDDFIAILSNITENGIVWYHCYYCTNPKIFRAQHDFGLGNIKDGEFRFATEEEKEKLFQAFKANGYKWNPETKALEKLIETKFKVGDRIRHVSNSISGIIIKIIDMGYYIERLDGKGISYINFKREKDCELVPNKFDINTLVPFESKVLVRNDENQRWLPAFWGYKVVDGFITTFGWCKYCIPYEGNEFLFKTNNDCDDYFKTWEK